MSNYFYHLRRRTLSYSLEGLMRFKAWWMDMGSSAVEKIENSQPLENVCFQDPYDFYKMIRDHYPVYKLPNGIYCISRYEDIVELSRDTDKYSSASQGVVAGLKPGENIEKKSRG